MLNLRTRVARLTPPGGIHPLQLTDAEIGDEIATMMAVDLERFRNHTAAALDLRPEAVTLGDIAACETIPLHERRLVQVFASACRCGRHGA